MNFNYKFLSILLIFPILFCKPKNKFPITKPNIEKPKGIETTKPLDDNEQLNAEKLLNQYLQALGNNDNKAPALLGQLAQQYSGSEATLKGFLKTFSSQPEFFEKKKTPWLEIFSKQFSLNPYNKKSQVAEYIMDYSSLLLNAGDKEESLKWLHLIAENYATDLNKLSNQRNNYLIGKIYDSTQNNVQAISAFSKILELDFTEQSRSEYSQKAEVELLEFKDKISKKESEQLLKGALKKPEAIYARSMVGIEIAKIFGNEGKRTKASKVLDNLIQKGCHRQFLPDAKFLKSRFGNDFSVNNNKIGVVLPLSGRFHEFGKRSLTAIKYVAQKYPNLELVVEDSTGNAAGVNQAIKKLVQKDGVIAIVGPIFREESFAASKISEELGVPLIGLGYKEGIADKGPFNFQVGLTVRDQAEGLASHVMNNGMKKFAFLYPRNKYGREFVFHFWNAAASQGGEVRGVESFEPNSTEDLRKISQKIVGRYYKRERVKGRTKELEPITDFDAIILPDGPKSIENIAATLAYEDIVLVKDKNKIGQIQKVTGYRNLSPVTLMGGSTWNTKGIVTDCHRDCEGAIFVDGFDLKNTHPTAINFIKAFKSENNSDPRINDGVAHDAMMLLGEAINNSQAGNREALRNALLQINGLQGVTGLLKVDKNGKIKRDLFVFSIQKRKITRIK